MVKSVLISIFALVSLAYASDESTWSNPITYPTSGTVWTFGDTRNITWETNAGGVNIPEDARGFLHIAFSSRSGFKHYMDIGTDIPLSTGFYEYNLPLEPIFYGEYKIILEGTDFNGTDTLAKSELFTINATPSLINVNSNA
ncbi:hypothetical protein BDF14DRAFT_1745828 [Spinellus fusiger]|nr:hypothetical protein BDF14DRAFT_1745828 [Spinellus fusiger]